MRRGRACLVVVALVAGGVTSSRSSAAQDAAGDAAVDERALTRASELFREGERFYDVGDYARAIVRFEQSYALSGAPTLLLNLAQAHRLSGPSHCEQALALYRRFLERRPRTQHRAEIEARIVEMQTCAVAQAEPRPIGEASETSASEATAPTASPASVGRDAVADRSEARVDSGVTSSGWSMIGWSGVTLGAVGVGVTAVSATLMLARSAELDDVCRADGGCPPTERGRIDDYETIRAITVGGAVAGGIGVAAAIVGFWRAASLERRGEAPRRNVTEDVSKNRRERPEARETERGNRGVFRARSTASGRAAAPRTPLELWWSPSAIGIRGAF